MAKHGWNSLEHYLEIHDKTLRFYHRYMESPRFYKHEKLNPYFHTLSCTKILVHTFKGTRARIDIAKDIEVDPSNPKRPRARTFRYSSEFVAVSPRGEILSYEFYLETLKGYCKELSLPEIGTHGLRHSASEMYLQHGVTEDDIRLLFAHSSPTITERYLHNRGRNLENVATLLRLFPTESSTNRPWEEINHAASENAVS